MRELQNEPLAPRTTLGIGGPAERLLELESAGELRAALADADRRGEAVTILGGGSNVVIADEGLRGVVLQLRRQRIERRAPRRAADDKRVELVVDAGVGWDALVAEAVGSGLAGLECLSGIPGHVGATPIQNVGAYGQQVADCIAAVHAYDREVDELVDLTAEECAFGYRDSAFKSRWPGRYVVLEVRFSLRVGPPEPARYAELGRTLEALGHRPSLQDVRDSVLALRRKKGMLFDRQDPEGADPDSRSAGSFFVNPTLPLAEVETLEARARAAGTLARDVRVPSFAADGDRSPPSGANETAQRRKISAAWLIEAAGFRRGHVCGNVGLSSRHALAIINRGGGTACEVRALAAAIQRRVRELFGIELRLEPVFLGASE